MKEKVSIVVPIYNAERTIQDCVDSLLIQTYKNIEVILVNDGSVDMTDTICRTYKKTDKRIKYVSQENRGEGGARNTGLELCSGKYITFVDSDDILMDNAVETLLKAAEGYDLVVGGIEKLETKKMKRYLPDSHIIQDKAGIAGCIMEDMYFMNTACCKLYRMDIIINHSITFNNYKYGADTVFVYQYLKYVNRIIFINEIVYHVNAVKGSVTDNRIEGSWRYMKDIYEKGTELIGSNDKGSCHKLLMRCVKTTLLLEGKISKESFINNCHRINQYIIKVDDRMIKSDSNYDKVIYTMITKRMYHLGYFLIRTRIRFSIGLEKR